MTSSTKEYNLQIQINFEVDVSSLKKYAPNTIAGPVFVAQSFVSTSETEAEAKAQSAAAEQTAATQKGMGKTNANRNGATQKDVGNKSNGGKAAHDESADDEKSDTPDPDAIRKAFKATIKSLPEIMAPGQKGQRSKKGGKK